MEHHQELESHGKSMECEGHYYPPVSEGGVLEGSHHAD